MSNRPLSKYEFQDLLLDIYSKLDDTVLIEHKRELIMLFEAVWKYIAMFNFRHDLLEYYNEEILFKHFILDIQQQEYGIIELGADLQSLFLNEKEPNNPLYQKIRDIRKNAKKRTPEEQAKIGNETIRRKTWHRGTWEQITKRFWTLEIFWFLNGDYCADIIEMGGVACDYDVCIGFFC